MQVSVITSLDELPSGFEVAARFPCVGDFFLSLDWFELLVAHGLSKEYGPRIYCVWGDNREPLAALYCCAMRVGQHLASLTSFYTIGYAPVLLSQSADLSLSMTAIVEYIAAERPRWRTIQLRFLRADLPPLGRLISALGGRRFSAHRFAQYENWFAPVAGRRFEDWWSARPSQLRNTVRRRAKKAEQRHRIETRILTSTGGDLEDAISAYTRVYDSSWKLSEPFADFMPSLIRRCAALGVLRFGELRVDGVPAACQVWIVSAGRAVIYKLAYDERYRDLSLGSMLSTALFRHVLDIDHVTELDYGVGGEAYKREWMTDVRYIEGISAFNMATAAGLTLAVTEGAKRLLRPLRNTRFFVWKAP